jgi:protein-tyrosine phosphatase
MNSVNHCGKNFLFAPFRLEGSKVLVHCKMGISRSGSTVSMSMLRWWLKNDLIGLFGQ